jgi:hypothetical protein
MVQILKTEVVKTRNSEYAVFTIPNSAGTGTYRVDVTNGRCDCMGWKMHRPNPVTGKRAPCKHLRQFGYTEA